MKLTIVSPETTLFSGEAVSVLVPGRKGQFEVLEGHAPIISSLGKGSVVYKTASESKTVDISGGFIDVANNEVSLCVEPE